MFTQNTIRETPIVVAKAVFAHAVTHAKKDKEHLYRIFFYDCPPSKKKVQLPISKKTYDLSKSPVAQFRLELYEQLKQKRKVALRLGKVNDTQPTWYPKKEVMRQLINGKVKFENLVDGDFALDIKQKQIDMKLGVDIASVSFKQQVSKIVLVAGDSDFVPAAKLARREGIDFILDPMWNHISPDLKEHIDGLMSYCPKPIFNHKSK
ncbi:MAG: NYN domain-containing protein [Candidatus Hinthialibacter antarcticus]|nr:NYN domain-containing protein [Candidatus Hinthialibacter antarcticus]